MPTKSPNFELTTNTKASILCGVIIAVLLIAIFNLAFCRNSEVEDKSESQSQESEQVVYDLDASIASASIDSDVKEKFKKLAAKEPLAKDFLGNLHEYPKEEASADASTPSEESNHAAPLLYQWDTRWGYVEYSGQPFGSSGCGPTALAMVYQGLTKKTDQSPYTIAMIARRDGYETESVGTDGRLFIDSAAELGLEAVYIEVDEEQVKAALQDGAILIFSLGEGDFTDSGHYIVVCGISGDKLIINDPYSSVNSNKTWDVGVVLEQTEAIYKFSV